MIAELIESVQVVTPQGEVLIYCGAPEFGYRSSSLMDSGNLIIEASLVLRRGIEEIARKVETVLEFRKARQPNEYPRGQRLQEPAR